MIDSHRFKQLDISTIPVEPIECIEYKAFDLLDCRYIRASRKRFSMQAKLNAVRHAHMN